MLALRTSLLPMVESSLRWCRSWGVSSWGEMERTRSKLLRAWRVHTHGCDGQRARDGCGVDGAIGWCHFRRTLPNYGSFFALDLAPPGMIWGVGRGLGSGLGVVLHLGGGLYGRAPGGASGLSQEVYVKFTPRFPLPCRPPWSRAAPSQGPLHSVPGATSRQTKGMKPGCGS